MVWTKLSFNTIFNHFSCEPKRPFRMNLCQLLEPTQSLPNSPVIFLTKDLQIFKSMKTLFFSPQVVPFLRIAQDAQDNFLSIMQEVYWHLQKENFCRSNVLGDPLHQYESCAFQPDYTCFQISFSLFTVQNLMKSIQNEIMNSVDKQTKN